MPKLIAAKRILFILNQENLMD